MKLNPFSQPSLIGIDIQPMAIYLVQLRKIKDEFWVERAAMSELPQAVFLEGKIKQWDVLRFALADLVDQYGMHGMTAAISLSANLVRMQEIQTPANLSAMEIEAEIYASIRKDFPGMTDVLSFDYVKLPQKKANYSNLFFAATRKEYLLHYIECIHAAGLKVKIVDIDIYAIKRTACYAWQSAVKESETNAMLSVIDGVATFIVFDSFNIRFYQHWDATEIDFSAELRARIQLYLSMFPDVRIENFLICGNKNWMMSGDLFDIRILYLDSFSQMKFASSHEMNLLRSYPAHFMIAAGLAMRKVPVW